MSNEPEEIDREVSRRVENPTDATADDAAAYQPPDTEPEADTDSGGSLGAAERASRDMDGDDEPTRSE